VPEEPKSIPQVMTELKELTISYAKQETIDPLKGLQRFVGYGIGGSLVLSIGLILLGLSGLRYMQTETGTRFTGNWSWAPYLITTLVLGGFAALSIRAISKDAKRE